MAPEVSADPATTPATTPAPTPAPTPATALNSPVDERLLSEAATRAIRYRTQLPTRRVTPSDDDLAGLEAFDEPFPGRGLSAHDTLALLDDAGSPATNASSGGAYLGYVVGGTVPVAIAADWMVTAWDQPASSSDTSPATAAIENVASRWMLEALDLPRHCSVGFTTGTGASTLTALAIARRSVWKKAAWKTYGWDLDRDGTAGAPPLCVYVPASAHVTVAKALRVLGIGTAQVTELAVTENRLVDVPAAVDTLADAAATPGILVLQAGELLTGGFDDFAQLIPLAHENGLWVHIDGAFGLWARASERTAALTTGVDLADSWAVDTHKWLNTPYDGAALVCRDAEAAMQTLNSDAFYIAPDPTAQRNRTLEFSRRARGVPVWAALRTLGQEGIAEMIDDSCARAQQIADGMRDLGFEVLGDVVLNQVLVRLDTDARTLRAREGLIATGRSWCSPALWQDRPALRFSVSSWVTTERDVAEVLDAMSGVVAALGAP